MRRLVQPAHRRARALLLLAVGVFAVAVLASTRRLERAYEASSTVDTEAVWMAYQLEFELQRLLLAAERYAAGPAASSHDELALRFDILWSRIPPVREGADGALLRSTTDVEAVVAELEGLLREAEPPFTGSAPDPAEVVAFVPRFEAFRAPLRAVVLEALAESARRQRRLHASLLGHLSANRVATLGLAATLLALLALMWFDKRRASGLLDLSRQEARAVRRLAEEDELTGLANRRLFERRLDEMLPAGSRGEGRVALLLLDLDRFKEVNDTLGHGAGDRLLQAVAGRLRGQLRRDEVVARLGGDEFVILQAGVRNPQMVGALAERIVASLARPFEIEGHRVRIGTSIGIAVAPDHADDRRRLLRLADAALYRAKAGDGPVCVTTVPAAESSGETARCAPRAGPEAGVGDTQDHEASSMAAIPSPHTRRP